MAKKPSSPAFVPYRNEPHLENVADRNTRPNPQRTPASDQNASAECHDHNGSSVRSRCGNVSGGTGGFRSADMTPVNVSRFIAAPLPRDPSCALSVPSKAQIGDAPEWKLIQGKILDG
jgi:hypothetical protein